MDSITINVSTKIILLFFSIDSLDAKYEIRGIK